MKKPMKKLTLILSLLLLTVPIVSLLGGCTLLYGNDRSSVILLAVREEGNRVLLTWDEWAESRQKQIVYDREQNTLTLSETEPAEEIPEPIFEGSTFPRESLIPAEGYESIVDRVLELDDSEEPYLTAFAQETSGMVYGFCVIYSGTVGFLSGGGNIDSRKAVKSVFFSYEKETEMLTVRGELEKRIAVAYDGTNAVWFSDGERTYYAGSPAGEGKRVCGDAAYDDGLTHYSCARFYQGGGYCLLFFHHGDSNLSAEFDRYVLTDMAGTFSAELTIPSAY